VANNLDVLCNIAGGACGAALGVLAVPSMLGGPLERPCAPRLPGWRRHRWPG